MKYLILLIALTGCATVDVYSIHPQSSWCVNTELRSVNYCTSYSEKETLDCYSKVRARCRNPKIIIKPGHDE
jgi:hypothetical protein